MNDNRTLLWVLIILLVAVFLGLVFIGVLIYMGTDTGDDSGNAVETSAAQTVAAGGISTPLPPPLPTEGPTPTPILDDPAKVLGNPTWIDTFDTKDNWSLFDNNCFMSDIKDGRFIMTAKGDEGFETITCWELTWPKVNNMYLEVNAQTQDQCSGADRYGLFFRGPDTSKGYVFIMTCDGRYAMANIDGQKVHMIAPLTASDKINTGPNQTNRIGVVADGGIFSLYINGQFVTQLPDSAYTTNGVRIGLAIGSSETKDFTVHYDDFAYWQLP
jgi:hypothetical protein